MPKKGTANDEEDKAEKVNGDVKHNGEVKKNGNAIPTEDGLFEDELDLLAAMVCSPDL